MTPYIIVPGWQNSGPDHWQTHWEHKFAARRVTQKDWLHPQKKDWLDALHHLVLSCSKPPLLITHSLGCNTTAFLSQETDVAIRGAFIVAPPNLEQADTPTEISNFTPTPMSKLRFPSIVIASSNDPYCEVKMAEQFANSWGSAFKNVGDLGHINVESGVGEWVAGQDLFFNFIKQL